MTKAHNMTQKFLRLQVHTYDMLWYCGNCDNTIETTQLAEAKDEWVWKKVEHPDLNGLNAVLPICPDCFLEAMEVDWDRTTIYTDNDGDGQPIYDNWFIGYEPV